MPDMKCREHELAMTRFMRGYVVAWFRGCDNGLLLTLVSRQAVD